MNDTMPAALESAASAWKDAVALREPDGDVVRETTYRELFEDVARFGRGLIALGVEPGDRVFLLADNSPRWLVSDQGILWAGAVCVPRGADTLADEAAYILRHSGAVAVVAERPELLDLLPERGAGLRARVLLGGEAEGAVTLSELLESGEGSEEEGRRHEIATIVYTSGTTGDPKGVVLTQANLLHQIRALPLVLDVHIGDRFLCVLPSWHMFERTAEYAALSRGGILCYASLRTLKQDLARERPQFLVAVPRLWEGIHGAFQSGLAKKGAFARGFARTLAASSLGWEKCRRRLGKTIHEDRVRRGILGGVADVAGLVLLAPLAFLGRRIVGGKIRGAVGGKLRYGISGGGHLPLHLDRFVAAMGVELLVGYGLTETSPVVTIRPPEDNVLGSMGKAVSEVEVRVVGPDGGTLSAGEVGELLIRGPNVMTGYYRNPEATEQVLDAEGWFRSGDLAEEIRGGSLLFRGRIKDTIVLSGGENVEPAPIEAQVIRSPFVRQVLTVGHDRKALAALVVPETELAAAEAADRGIDVEELIRSEIRELISARTGFKARERIGRVAVLDREFTVADGTLTRTLKLKRNVILERYRDVIESLYR